MYPLTVTCIRLVRLKESLFMGMSNGTIRMYLWPFTNFSIQQQEYVEIALHQFSVCQMNITPDLTFLVSGSEDGSVFITRLR
jgi:WD40 repeat protein